MELVGAGTWLCSLGYRLWALVSSVLCVFLFVATTAQKLWAQAWPSVGPGGLLRRDSGAFLTPRHLAGALVTSLPQAPSPWPATAPSQVCPKLVTPQGWDEGEVAVCPAGPGP